MRDVSSLSITFNIMKTYIILIVACLSLLSGKLQAQQAPNWQWAVSPGGGAINDIVIDDAGNIYSTGSFSGSRVFGSTTLQSAFSTAYIAKQSSDGSYLWAIMPTASSTDYHYSTGSKLAIKNNYLYLTGFYLSDSLSFGSTTLIISSDGINSNLTDLFVAKIDLNGQWQWAVGGLGTKEDYAIGIALKSNGNSVIYGSFSSPTLQLGTYTLTNSSVQGDDDMFIAEISSNGVWEWASSASGNYDEYPSDVLIDENDNIYLTGIFSSPTLTCGIHSVASQQYWYNLFLAKANSLGEWQWLTSAIGASDPTPYSLNFSSTHDLLLCGSYSTSNIAFGSTLLSNPNVPTTNWSNNLDIFIATADTNGNWLSAIRPDATGYNTVLDACTDLLGNIYLTGGFSTNNSTFGSTTLVNQSNPSFFYDVFVCKISESGISEWAIRAGAGDTEVSSTIAIDNNQNVYVGGYFNQPNTSFGSITLPFIQSGSLVCSFLARLGNNTTGLSSEFSTPAFILNPNPARETVQLSGLPSATAILLDALGRTVRTVSLIQGAATLDVRGLPAGLYVVRAGSTTWQLVVE